MRRRVQRGPVHPLLGARCGRGVHDHAPVIFGPSMIKTLMTAVFGTRFDRERKRIQPVVDAIHGHEERLKDLGRGRAQGADARVSRAPRPSGPARSEGRAGRGSGGQARLRRSGRAGGARGPVPRAGEAVQEGAGGRPRTSCCPRPSPRCARRAAGCWAPRSGDRARATWDMVPYDVQLIGGVVLHRAGSPRWRPARARPWSPPCRST